MAGPARSTVGGAVRFQRWWAAKVLPVLGAAGLAALVTEAAPADALPRFAAMVVSAIGIAAASHLVNDWADLAADAAAGKPNGLAARRTVERAALVTGAGAVGVLPWLLVRPGPAAVALLVALAVLPVLYSVPPTRLKGRGVWGVLADAADAHVVPTLLAFALLYEVGEPGRLATWTVAGAAVWSAGLGVRAILAHQRADLANDVAASVPTYVARHGAARTVRLGWAAMAVELVGLAALWASVVVAAPVVAVGFAAYLGLWLLHRRWDRRPFQPVPAGSDDWLPLVEFYEVWPAVGFSLALVGRDGAWWPLPVALAVGFAGAVAKQATDLGRLLAHLGHDVRVVARRGWWWVHDHPIAWVRFELVPRTYWAIHDFFADIGHFQRRQRRRMARWRRRWRARRG